MIPPTLGWEKFLNFGPQTKKLSTWVLTHRSAHFSGYCISALKGGCALKFLHELEIDQGYLAHTPIGTWVPPKKINRENFTFGLKFSVCTSITSGLMGLVGIFSPNFFQATWWTLVHKRKSYSAHIDPPELLVYCKLTQVHMPSGSFRSHSPAAIAARIWNT